MSEFVGELSEMLGQPGSAVEEKGGIAHAGAEPGDHAAGDSDLERRLAGIGPHHAATTADVGQKQVEAIEVGEPESTAPVTHLTGRYSITRSS
jgi:hypothetical protein